MIVVNYRYIQLN